VNFATGTSATPPTPARAAAAGGKLVKPAAKPAARQPLSPAELEQAKHKREQLNDAFHGRLAGIKQNVDALNHRLSDFEEKVHKEDVNLDKGNPNDFKVDLD